MKTINYHFRNILTMLAAIILSALASCTEDTTKPEEPETKPSSLTLAQEEVNMTAESGEAKISYTLENPQEGIQIGIINESEWISDINTAVDGEISMTVASNEEFEAREAVVTVTYGEDINETFKVIQQGAEKPADFIINIESTTTSSVTYGITPLDNEMPYVNRIVAKEYFESMGSEENIFADDMEAINEYISYYGMSMEEYLNTYLLKGPSTGITKKRVMPSNEFVVYAYGMDYSGKPLTGIVSKETATASVEMKDVTFDISVDAGLGEAEITFTPSDNDQYYLADIATAEEMEMYEDYFRMRQGLLRENLYMYEDMGMPDPNLILNGFCKKGEYTKTFSVKSDTEYYAFAVCVSDDIFFCSEPSQQQFTTDKVAQSDNVITINVTDIETRIANYEINTTNDDPYVYITLESSAFKSLSDDEIIEQLLNTYDFSNFIRSGSQSGRLNNLEPETEYYMFAFGYEAGAATTRLSKFLFKTTEIVQSNVTFSLVLDKYFSGKEYQEAYPEDVTADISGHAVVLTAVIAEPSDRVSIVYYDILTGDCTDPSTISDEELIPQLVSTGSSWRWNRMLMKYDMDFTLVGVSVDITGNYGPVWRKHVVFTEDGASPIEEYEEYNDYLMEIAYGSSESEQAVPKIGFMRAADL